jgi:hypothetical protein
VLSNSESTASLVWINSISRARAEIASVFFKALVISPSPIDLKMSIVLISGCPAAVDNSFATN